MISIQSLTFLGVAFLISWTCLIGGYYGGFVEVPGSLIVLSLSMMGPALSALLCVKLFGPGLKSIQWTPHFKRSIWWAYAWLIPVAFTALSMAITLLGAPDAHFQSTINNVEIGPLILLQALILGPLINTPVLTFTEELGWRGYLYDLWRPFGFWVCSIATGLIWGLWHAPAVFLYGWNYPEHPVMGIPLLMGWCALLSPIITLVREKTGSVWAAGLFHGTVNALGGLSVMLMGNPAFPWKGPLGLGGLCLLLIGVAAIKWLDKPLGLKKQMVGMTMVLTTLCGVCLADSPETFQHQADTLREEGKTLDALNLYNHALVGYQQKQDYHGVLRVLGGRLISWQHLFNHEEDKVYAILARKEAEAMLAIAQEYAIHDRDHVIHYLFGKSCIFLKDFPGAEREFAQAVVLFPNDDAEKGDWMAHLGDAAYRNGRKEEGERIILEGIRYIQAHYHDKDLFRMNVWISGAYLRLAKNFLYDKKFEQAKMYFQKGEAIILSDPRLVIRNQQLNMLRKKIDEQG